MLLFLVNNSLGVNKLTTQCTLDMINIDDSLFEVFVRTKLH